MEDASKAPAEQALPELDGYLVVHREWLGQAGWKEGSPGEPLWNTKYTEFHSEDGAVTHMRKTHTGCGCCPDLPAKVELGVWYPVGYADKVMVRKPTRVPVDQWEARGRHE